MKHDVCNMSHSERYSLRSAPEIRQNHASFPSSCKSLPGANRHPVDQLYTLAPHFAASSRPRSLRRKPPYVYEMFDILTGANCALQILQHQFLSHFMERKEKAKPAWSVLLEIDLSTKTLLSVVKGLKQELSTHATIDKDAVYHLKQLINNFQTKLNRLIQDLKHFKENKDIKQSFYDSQCIKENNVLYNNIPRSFQTVASNKNIRSRHKSANIRTGDDAISNHSDNKLKTSINVHADTKLSNKASTEPLVVNEVSKTKRPGDKSEHGIRHKYSTSDINTSNEIKEYNKTYLNSMKPQLQVGEQFLGHKTLNNINDYINRNSCITKKRTKKRKKKTFKKKREQSNNPTINNVIDNGSISRESINTIPVTKIELLGDKRLHESKTYKNADKFNYITHNKDNQELNKCNNDTFNRIRTGCSVYNNCGNYYTLPCDNITRMSPRRRKFTSRRQSHSKTSRHSRYSSSRIFSKHRFTTEEKTYMKNIKMFNNVGSTSCSSSIESLTSESLLNHYIENNNFQHSQSVKYNKGKNMGRTNCYTCVSPSSGCDSCDFHHCPHSTFRELLDYNFFHPNISYNNLHNNGCICHCNDAHCRSSFECPVYRECKPQLCCQPFTGKDCNHHLPRWQMECPCTILNNINQYSVYKSKESLEEDECYFIIESEEETSESSSSDQELYEFREVSRSRSIHNSEYFHSNESVQDSVQYQSKNRKTNHVKCNINSESRKRSPIKHFYSKKISNSNKRSYSYVRVGRFVEASSEKVVECDVAPEDTSETRLTKLVNVVGTNTEKVALKEQGIDPIPQTTKLPDVVHTNIETDTVHVESKQTSTEGVKIKHEQTETEQKRVEVRDTQTSYDQVSIPERRVEEMADKSQQFDTVVIKPEFKHARTSVEPIETSGKHIQTSFIDEIKKPPQEEKQIQTIKTETQTQGVNPEKIQLFEQTVQTDLKETMSRGVNPDKFNVREKEMQTIKTETQSRGVNPDKFKVHEKEMQTIKTETQSRGVNPDKFKVHEKEMQTIKTETHSRGVDALQHNIHEQAIQTDKKNTVSTGVNPDKIVLREEEVKDPHKERIIKVIDLNPIKTNSIESKVGSDLSMHLTFEKIQENIYKRYKNNCKEKIVYNPVDLHQQHNKLAIRENVLSKEKVYETNETNNYNSDNYVELPSNICHTQVLIDNKPYVGDEISYNNKITELMESGSKWNKRTRNNKHMNPIRGYDACSKDNEVDTTAAETLGTDSEYNSQYTFWQIIANKVKGYE